MELSGRALLKIDRQRQRNGCFSEIRRIIVGCVDFWGEPNMAVGAELFSLYQFNRTGSHRQIDRIKSVFTIQVGDKPA